MQSNTENNEERFGLYNITSTYLQDDIDNLDTLKYLYDIIGEYSDYFCLAVADENISSGDHEAYCQLVVFNSVCQIAVEAFSETDVDAALKVIEDYGLYSTKPIFYLLDEDQTRILEIDDITRSVLIAGIWLMLKIHGRNDIASYLSKKLIEGRYINMMNHFVSVWGRCLEDEEALANCKPSSINTTPKTPSSDYASIVDEIIDYTKGLASQQVYPIKTMLLELFGMEGRLTEEQRTKLKMMGRDSSSEKEDISTLVQQAVEATFRSCRITLQNEFIPIWQIMRERNIHSVTKASFCRAVAKYDVNLKPSENDFKKIDIRGNFPNWNSDNGKAHRYVEIATEFLRQYDSLKQ